MSELDTGQRSWDGDSSRSPGASVRQTLGDRGPSSCLQVLQVALLEGSVQPTSPAPFTLQPGRGQAREIEGLDLGTQLLRAKAETRAQGLGWDMMATRILECTCVFIAHTCLPCCSRVLSNPRGTFVFVLPQNKSLPSECGFCWNLYQSVFSDMVLACPVQCPPAYKPSEIMRDVSPMHVAMRGCILGCLHNPGFPESGIRSQDVTVHW